MNVPPEKSSDKCGRSDFSIERILSDDTKFSETSEIPSWLCCTRYQPPRLPRAQNACRARRSGRHARVPFTSAQASALEAAYTRSQYLAPPALRALAAALQLRDDRIKIWFQNRRARDRREKSGTITPPHAVVLPSTTTSNRDMLNEWCQNHAYTYTTEYTQADNNLENNLRRSLVNSPCFIASSSISEEESDEIRCDTPLDVESIED